MTKDPAFLFYSSDFLTGVANLTYKERGQYITLMCLQHQHGRLSKKLIDLNVPEVSEDVLSKFSVDKNGDYFNKRLDDEIKKRRQHSKKQRENALKRWNKGDSKSMPPHKPDESQGDTNDMPLENENDNENKVKDIVDYLNSKTESKFKSTTKETVKSINARMREGYTLEDFLKVIDTKCSDWIGTDFEKHLTPSTLFRPSNFEKYLNQKPKIMSLEDRLAEELNE